MVAERVRSIVEPSDGRYFDGRFKAYVLRVAPGGSCVAGRPDEMIVTVLGSCVAACVRNPRKRFGGMNHFMLPASDTGNWNGISAAMRYGNFAMESLINQVLKSGCSREEIEIKLFGGADLYPGNAEVGSKNVGFALDYLAAEGLQPAATDLGGGRARRIHFFPATGRVLRLAIRPHAAGSLHAEEARYARDVNSASVEGAVDLF